MFFSSLSPLCASRAANGVIWLKDAEAAEIVLEDGTKHQADLLVGADGVHVSKVVAAT